MLCRRGLIGVLVLAGCGGGGGAQPTTATLSGRVVPSGAALTAAAKVTSRRGARASRPQDCCRGEAVAWFANGLSPDDAVRRINQTLGTALRIEALLTENGPARLVGGPPDYDGTAGLIERLSALPEVAAAEPNLRCGTSQEAPVSLAPNDPVTTLFSWSFEMIRTEGAWSMTRGDPSIVVAVIDSGVGLAGVPHPDLGGQLLPGYDFFDGDSDATDVPGKSSHGTHVTGTIAALANNATGVAGIAPRVRVVPIRALGPSGGSSFVVAQAILWAIGENVPGAPLNPNPARVINMSLGSAASSQVERDAVEAAAAAGVVIVAAAGNSNTAVGFPAGFEDVIAVSAVGPSATITRYSNFGPEIDLTAPGGALSSVQEQVWSTQFNANSDASYAPSPGTSMASPHVAAVAALVLSANPNLTAAQVRTVLQETALDLGVPGRDVLYGFGLVDAQAAVERALELADTPAAAEPARLAARTPFLRQRRGS